MLGKRGDAVRGRVTVYDDGLEYRKKKNGGGDVVEATCCSTAEARVPIRSTIVGAQSGVGVVSA